MPFVPDLLGYLDLFSAEHPRGAIADLPIIPEWNIERIFEFSFRDSELEGRMDGRREARIVGLGITAVYVCLLLAALGSA